MRILCLGISHHTAPVALRERLHFPTAALPAALARLAEHAEPVVGVDELVILSTCNRLELYAVVPEAPPASQTSRPTDRLLGFLEATRGVPRAEYASHLYHVNDADAVAHLCRVAAGLDSMILGEPQILGQVTQAYQVAAAHGTAGPILSGLFRTAIRAGKRARTDTAIGRNPATLSSVAVKLATQAAGDLAAQRVLVVGAGEMAALAVEALRARGVTHLTVINRTRTRAAQLAQRWGARTLPYEHLAEALAEADLVLTSTDAPNAVISAALARAALQQRAERPVVFIDLAVPRDVDPEVRRLPNVRYYDIDDLAASLNGALAERQQEVPRVEAIVVEEARACLDWLNGLAVAPLIAGLRAKAEALRRAEVEKTLRRLPQLDEAERRQIEALTEALINKLLHVPIQRLKAESQQGSPGAYAAAVRELFALND